MRINGRLKAWLGAALLGLALIGCASTTTWTPGDPDAATIEHYTLAQSAIARKSIADAKAALYLLRLDITRMRTNAPEMMASLARMYDLENAADRGDWDQARIKLEDLRAAYGRPRQ